MSKTEAALAASVFDIIAEISIYIMLLSVSYFEYPIANISHFKSSRP